MIKPKYIIISTHYIIIVVIICFRVHPDHNMRELPLRKMVTCDSPLEHFLRNSE